MSREYKFRAWDKKKNIFVPQGEIVFSDYGDTKVVVVPNCIEYIGDSCHEYEDSNRFEIGQFTGRKDINNVEIYEGDIIVMNDYPFYGNAEVITDSNQQCDELNYVGVVEWDDYIGYFLNLKPVSNRVRGGAYGSTLQYYDDMLVVGNIYENPELLEYR